MTRNNHILHLSLSHLSGTRYNLIQFSFFPPYSVFFSQEILRWKLLFTWSPAEGVKVLKMEQLPHCHECENPLSTTWRPLTCVTRLSQNTATLTSLFLHECQDIFTATSLIHEKCTNVRLSTVNCASFETLWRLLVCFSENKVCEHQDLRYRTGDGLSERHFGLPHHTMTVVFPLHPLRQHKTHTSKERWEAH